MIFKIELLLKQKKIQKKTVAEWLGVSQQQVSNIFSIDPDKRPEMTRDRIQLFAEKLGVSTSYLMDDAVAPNFENGLSEILSQEAKELLARLKVENSQIHEVVEKFIIDIAKAELEKKSLRT